MRQVDVLVARGQPTATAVKAIAVSEQRHYRWRNEYVGLRLDHTKRLRGLQTENARLRKVVSDLTLDKFILQEAIREK